MVELVLGASIWAVLATVVFIGLLAISTWQEASAWAFGAAVVYTVFMAWAFGINAYSWAYENPIRLFLYFGGYVFVGVMWSMFKWDRRMASEAVQDAIKDGKANHTRKAIMEPFRESSYFPKEAMPSRNKERITSWISLWPFSVTGYFIGEIILRFFSNLYNLISGLYENITERHIK